MLRLASVSVICLLFVCSTPAQIRSSPSTLPKYINGEVRLPDGRPAGVGLYVSLESDASGGFSNTQTDSRGKFSFPGLANVRYRVKVRAPGYEEATQEVDLSTMSMSYLTFNLKAKPGTTPLPEPVSGVVSAPVFPDGMSDDAKKEFGEGFDIFSSGKNQSKSISHFKKSAEKYPNYAPTYYYIGAAYAIDGKLDEAVPALQKSIELNDKAPEAIIALGSVYNKQKKYPEAEKVLTRAVQLAPESFEAHEELAKSIMPVLARTPEAEQHLTKAVALNGKSVEAHILLGNVFLRKRDNDGALREYKEAIRLDPKGPMATPVKEMIGKIENNQKASK
jgi:Tfp pilus assembly protein PilF